MRHPKRVGRQSNKKSRKPRCKQRSILMSFITGSHNSHGSREPQSLTPQIPLRVLKIDDSFYFHYRVLNSTEEVWLISASAQGPWVPAQTVPEDAIAVVCGQLNVNPNEPYLLCALPWPS